MECVVMEPDHVLSLVFRNTNSFSDFQNTKKELRV